jgi:hypothetical protein
MHERSNPEGTYLPVIKYLDALGGEEPHASAVMIDAVKMAAAVLDAAKEFNVRHLSPNDMVRLGRRLYLLGAIGLVEFAIMTDQSDLHPSYRFHLRSYRALFDYPERPRDMLHLWQKHLAELPSHHPTPGDMDMAWEVYELLQSFEPFDDEVDDTEPFDDQALL